jgi:hypothetical protein
MWCAGRRSKKIKKEFLNCQDKVIAAIKAWLDNAARHGTIKINVAESEAVSRALLGITVAATLSPVHDTMNLSSIHSSSSNSSLTSCMYSFSCGVNSLTGSYCCCEISIFPYLDRRLEGFLGDLLSCGDIFILLYIPDLGLPPPGFIGLTTSGSSQFSYIQHFLCHAIMNHPLAFAIPMSLTALVLIVGLTFIPRIGGQPAQAVTDFSQGFDA